MKNNFDEILQLINDDKFDFSGWFKLSCVSLNDNILRTHLKVSLENGKHEKVFEIRFERPVKFQFVPGTVNNDFEVTVSHPLTWNYSQEFIVLSFIGQPKNIKKVLADLKEAHSEAAGHWIPFLKYFNSQMDLEKLLAGGFGRLAVGPVELIEKYASVLESHSVKTSSFGGGTPTYWDYWNKQSQSRKPYPKSLQALVVDDEEFVIFENATVELLNK